MKHQFYSDVRFSWPPARGKRRQAAPDWCADPDACRVYGGVRVLPGSAACRPCGFLSQPY